MPLQPRKKHATQLKIFEAAQNTFHKQGYGPTRVADIAAAAGLTTGAFYATFHSKQQAFHATIIKSMADLNAILHAGKTQTPPFNNTTLPDHSPLPNLLKDLNSAHPETQAAFTSALTSALNTIAESLPHPDPRERRRQAITWLAAKSGATALAQAAPAFAGEILAAIPNP